MNYELLEKMPVEELKNYLQISGLKLKSVRDEKRTGSTSRSRI